MKVFFYHCWRWLTHFVTGEILSHKYDFQRIKKGAYLNDVEIAVAYTEEDYLQAFKLVYESYLRTNITNENRHELRMTKHHLLPSTLVIVAKLGSTGEVIATMSLFSDTHFGLPLDSIEDLTALRGYGRLTEVGALAIKEEYRTLRGQLLLPITQFAFAVGKVLLNTDYGVYMVHPKAKRFYEILFDAYSITGKVHIRRELNNAPALALYHSIKDQDLDWAANSWTRPEIGRDCCGYMLEGVEAAKTMFGDRDYYTDYQSKLSEKMVRRLFDTYRQVFSDLNFDEIRQLRNLYAVVGSEQPLDSEQIQFFSMRKSDRILARLKGRLQVSGELHSIYVRDVSKGGLTFFSNVPLYGGELFEIELDVGNHKVARVQIKILWARNQNQYGARLLAGDGVWHQYLVELHKLIRLPKFERTG